RLILMFCAGSFASAQITPSFRSNASLQLSDENSTAPETLPAGSASRDLFSPLPEFRPRVKSAPTLPATAPPMPRTAQDTAWTRTPLRVASLPAANLSRPSERPTETPSFLQRHPDRSVIFQDGTPAFTLRSTSDAAALAQISIGLQSNIWHTD